MDWEVTGTYRIIKKELLKISISSAIELQKYVKITFLFCPEMNLMILESY